MLLGLGLLDALTENGRILALLQSASLFLAQIGPSVQDFLELLDP